MSEGIKKAAEELLRVAEAIEQEAAEVTKFVCDTCNHTASLSKINSIRGHVAKTAGENVTVSPITVNDKVSCPACEGNMAYVATEESTPYYFDPDKVATEETVPGSKPESEETPADEAKETPEVQKEEAEKGVEKHEVPAAAPANQNSPTPQRQASIDYDSLDRYIKG